MGRHISDSHTMSSETYYVHPQSTLRVCYAGGSMLPGSAAICSDQNLATRRYIDT